MAVLEKGINGGYCRSGCELSGMLENETVI